MKILGANATEPLPSTWHIPRLAYHSPGCLELPLSSISRGDRGSQGGVSCPGSIACHPWGRHCNLLRGTAVYLLAHLCVRVREYPGTGPGLSRNAVSLCRPGPVGCLKPLPCGVEGLQSSPAGGLGPKGSLRDQLLCQWARYSRVMAVLFLWVGAPGRVGRGRCHETLGAAAEARRSRTRTDFPHGWASGVRSRAKSQQE